MLYIFLFVIALVSIHPVRGDMPDNVLDSGVYEVLEHIGDDYLIDVTYSENDSVTSCFGYTVSDESTKFWILSLNHSGIPVDRKALDILHDGPTDWISGVFSEPGLLFIINGECTPGILPEYLTIGLMDPRNSSHTLLPVEVDPDEILTILALEKYSDEYLLAVATRWSPDDDNTLSVIKLAHDGTILWETPIAEKFEEQFIRADSRIMSDGGCVLSYSLDCFPSSSIPICRLGSDGQILWQQSLHVGCEFVAGISDFRELDNGNIICTGTVDEMGQMAYRGLTVCLDSGGSELWRRIDWYLDHTLFRCAGITPQGDLLISGWTGEEGNYPLEVVNSDVLLVIMNNDGSRIIGTELPVEGDQMTNSVFITESGQVIVTGTGVQSGDEESDVFFLKIDFEELR